MTSPFFNSDLSDESLEQAAEQAFIPQDKPSPSDGNVADDNVQQPVEGIQSDSGQEQFTLPEDFEYEPGKRMSRQSIANYASFDSLLSSDPQLARIIYNHLRGESAPEKSSEPGTQPLGHIPQEGVGRLGSGLPTAQAPTPSPFTPPADLDLSDPTVKYLYDVVGQQQATLANYHSELARQQDIIGSRVRAENQEVINSAVGSFKQQYNLDDADIVRIQQAAGQLPIVGQIMQTGIDPMTGQPTPPNALNAVTKALEYAAYAIPEIRDKLLSQQQMQDQVDNTRRAKLSSVGGSSRPAPRQTAVPNTPEARNKAFIAEVAANMFPGS